MVPAMLTVTLPEVVANMIHLFKTIYLQADNYVGAYSDQQRIIFTDRQYKNPFVSKDELPLAGIMDTVFSLQELQDKHGGFEGLLQFLWLSDQKILVIAKPQWLTTLLVSYWKGLVEKPTAASLYKLYGYFIRNENLFTTALNRFETSEGLHEDRELPLMSFEDFQKIFDETAPSEMAKTLPKEDIPVEFLLAGYLGGTNNTTLNEVTFEKVKRLVLANLVDILDNDRVQFFRNTHNQYLLDGESDIREIVDPLELLRSNPKFSWLFDENFNQKNLDNVVRKYGLKGINDIFEQFNAVFYKGQPYYAAQAAMQFLAKDNMPGLLDYDIQDENANFFAERLYLRKVNTLLISYFYQLVRLKRSDELRIYKLLD